MDAPQPVGVDNARQRGAHLGSGGEGWVRVGVGWNESNTTGLGYSSVWMCSCLPPHLLLATPASDWLKYCVPEVAYD